MCAHRSAEHNARLIHTCRRNQSCEDSSPESPHSCYYCSCGLSTVTHLRDLVVERDTSRLDGDTTVSLVLTGIGKALVASRGHGNDTSRRNQRVRERGLACKLAPLVKR
jgi:hypothetical protein